MFAWRHWVGSLGPQIPSIVVYATAGKGSMRHAKGLCDVGPVGFGFSKRSGESFESRVHCSPPHVLPFTRRLRRPRRKGLVSLGPVARSCWHPPHSFWRSRPGLSRRSTLDGFVSLVFGQLWLAPELDAFGHGALAAVASALADQIPLELSDPGQQRRQKAALRAGSVPQRVSERPERRAGLADALDQIEQLARGTAKPIELRDQHDIAGLQQGPSTSPAADRPARR